MIFHLGSYTDKICVDTWFSTKCATKLFHEKCSTSWCDIMSLETPPMEWPRPCCCLESFFMMMSLFVIPQFMRWSVNDLSVLQEKTMNIGKKDVDPGRCNTVMWGEHKHDLQSRRPPSMCLASSNCSHPWYLSLPSSHLSRQSQCPGKVCLCQLNHHSSYNNSNLFSISAIGWTMVWISL